MRKERLHLRPKFIKGTISFNLQCLVIVSTRKQDIHFRHGTTSLDPVNIPLPVYNKDTRKCKIYCVFVFELIVYHPIN